MNFRIYFFVLTHDCTHTQTHTNTHTHTHTHTHIEVIQITSSSGIYKTNIYHNDCYLQLFVFKFQMNNNSLIEISASLF